MADTLQKEFDYFLANKEWIVTGHEGEVAAIRDCRVVRYYPSTIEAINDMKQEYEVGTFLVKKCQHEDDTVTIHTPGITA